MGIFQEYINFRENNTVTSKVKLQKPTEPGKKEFSPFTVDRSNHSDLRMLVRAFGDSDQTPIGHTTIEKNKGEVEAKLKRKNLWLTGGAVRDHLKGKTPKNYDLVTDATPSEVRLILTKAEDKFVEVKPKNPAKTNLKQYVNLPLAGGKNKIFYASRWDKSGKELEFTVEINRGKFEIATLSKGPKSRRITPEKGESAASIEDDASNRDFTINAMYIPLTQYDGENSDLIDPHGGAHHLKSGEIHPIGSMGERLKEDPVSALRYIKYLGRFGNGNSKIPEKHLSAISQVKDLADVPKEVIHGEFLDGLEHQDTDPKKFLKLFKSSGLLASILPKAEFDEKELPEDLRNDRFFVVAWTMKDVDPAEVKESLEDKGWSKQEACDISYLVKLYQWAKHSKYDADKFYDLKSTHTGLSKNKMREWMQMAKAHGPEFDAFLNHEDNDLKPMVSDALGNRGINPAYIEFLGGKTPQGYEFATIKKLLSTKKFKDSLNKLK